MKNYSTNSYDLIVVTGEPFPLGMAATNRLLCYTTAIAKYRRILVLTFGAPYDCPAAYGAIDGVDFRYMHNKCDRPSKVKRLILLLYRYIKLLFLLLFTYKCKSILLLSRKSIYALMIKIIALIKHVRFYREMSEFPKFPNKIKQEFARYTNKIFDGIIVISKDLEASVRHYVGYEKDIMCLPVLVQINRFDGYLISEKRNFAFYCSGGNVERDGLLDILNGFLLYKQSLNTDIVLEIATSFNPNNRYHKCAMDLIFAHPEAFLYLGCLPTTEIPKKLMEASILLLTPHKNYITKGFPTKLGEYLASGTPVICSSIDDLREQIPDTVVKFVLPNAPSEICGALLELLPFNDVSQKLGLTGRQWVEKNYTMMNYTSDLIDFLKL